MSLQVYKYLVKSQTNLMRHRLHPRVQVEHTVTEMITGTDLVSMGIRVAAGEPIKLIQDDIQIRGHAIQVRLNAENPVTLAPSPGKLWECHWPGGPGVRIDTHAHTGYDMPASFDSLLAKLIVWAPTRDESISKLNAALHEIKLLGVDTLIPLHLAILSENDFRKRNITIHYLEEHPDLLSGG